MIPAVLWWVPPCGVLSLLEKLPSLFELGEDMWRKVSPQFWWTSMILMLICLNVANTLWSLWLTLPKTFGASRKHIRIWLSDMPLELLMYVTMWYGRLSGTSTSSLEGLQSSQAMSGFVRQSLATKELGWGDESPTIHQFHLAHLGSPSPRLWMWTPAILHHISRLSKSPQNFSLCLTSHRARRSTNFNVALWVWKSWSEKKGKPLGKP